MMYTILTMIAEIVDEDDFLNQMFRTSIQHTEKFKIIGIFLNIVSFFNFTSKKNQRGVNALENLYCLQVIELVNYSMHLMPSVINFCALYQSRVSH